MDRTLIDLLRRRAEQQPERRGFSFLHNGERETAAVTYGELDAHARRIGAMLQERKAQGERILLLYPPGLDFLAAFFGCLYAGAIAVPAYPPRRQRQLSRIPAIVADAQARFALTTKVFQAKIETWFAHQAGQTPLTVIAAGFSTEEKWEEQWKVPDVCTDDLAFLQYTSGSTANPKGVMVSHENLLHNSMLIYKSFGHSSESIFMSWLPHYHDMGLIGGILQPLFGGFPVILMSPAAFIQHPIRWLRAISTYQASTSGGPNFGYELCVDKIAPEQFESLDLQSWKVAFNGAEPVHHETLEQFSRMFGPCGFRKRAFYPCFGLAEATLFVTGPRPADPPLCKSFQESALELNRLVENSPEEIDSRTFVGCGASPPEQQLCIVDPETRTLCPPGQVGEIWVSGPSVARGYWKRPKETRETFQAKLAPQPPLLRREGAAGWASDAQPESSSRLKPARGPQQGASASLNSQDGHLMAGRETEFLRTGDLGFIHEGQLFITGRLKDLIIIRGRNHYPEDIEWRVEHCHKLIRHEGSAVFTLDIDNAQHLVVAAEVEHQHWERRRGRRKKDYGGAERRRPNHQQPAVPRIAYVEKAVRAIRKVVSDHHELQVYAVLLLKTGSMPKTSSGKTQRQLCRSRYLDGSLEVIASSVLSAVEAGALEDSMEVEHLRELPRQEQQSQFAAYLARLIASALRIDPAQVEQHQALSHFGLDSIVALELQHRLESALNLNWPLTTFLSSTSIAELAEEGVRQLSTAPAPRTSARIATHLRGKIPLSHNQRALWFLYRLSPQSAAYNVPFVLRIRSKLDRPALRRAFQRIIARHDVLRSTYHEVDGEPRQHIHEHLPLPFEEIDAAGWDRAAIQERISEQIHCPFDLEKGPVMTLTLFNIADDDAILALNVHHIAIDFWSLLVLMDELRMLYPAECSGRAAQLPIHALSYADFISWQLEMAGGQEGERLLAYWREKLTGNLADGEFPVLDLPSDRPRPAVQSYRGAAHSFDIGRELTEELRTLSRETGATLYMLLLSAFYVLLHRYSGQEDLIVGTPTAGRMFSEFDDVLGYFVNPVMLRVNLAENPGFTSLLQQVRQVVLEALEHQAYPFSLLVERLKLQRDAGRSPGFQVMFVMQEPHRLEEAAPFALRESGASMDLGGLQVESVKVGQRSAQFDLTLMLVNTGEGLWASFTYNADLFEATAMKRMAGHFKTLLQGIIAHPEQTVAELPILTEAERRQILVEWNDTAAEYPLDKCIHELFEEQVERTPEAVAVVCGDKHLTYRELNNNANQLAHYLRKLGIAPEVPVGICLERSLEMIIALYGILKAGGTYVPLDPAYPGERLAFMSSDLQMPVILSQKKFEPKIHNQDAAVICLDAAWDTIARERQDNLENGVSPDDPIYIIYTSGSTGRPKGAGVYHRGCVNLVNWFIKRFELCSTDNVLLMSSLSFDLTQKNILAPLMIGGTLHLQSGEYYDAYKLSKIVREKRITWINCTPSAFYPVVESSAEHAFADLASLRYVFLGGESIIGARLRNWIDSGAFQTRIVNVYGPTECTAVCASYTLEEPAQFIKKAVPIGQPIFNAKILILDKRSQLVPVGIPGELYIGGEGVGAGYIHNKELTQKKFIRSPYPELTDTLLYRTGDLARYLPDGNIEFLGRIDHQVKIRGFRIELEEIETILASHPAVHDAVVLAREDEPEHKTLVTYLVRQQGAALETSELRAFLREQLPEYMVPSAFIVVKAFPLTPNKKIDRHALPAPKMVLSEHKEEYVAPRNQTEIILAEIWADVLKLDHVGIHDNFFEIGGDSIISMKIVTRSKQAGLQVSPANILQYQTIADLSPAVTSVSASPKESVPVHGEFPLTPVQQWFFEQNFSEAHHWNQAMLLECRQKPDKELLRQALNALVRQHDTLRLRFRQLETGWIQKYTDVDSASAVVLTHLDLSRMPDVEQEQTAAAEAEELQQSLNFMDGPLFRAALFDFGPEKSQRLLLVSHHLLVDAVSWQILLEDLERIYHQLTNACDVSQTDAIPVKTSSFTQWASYLKHYAHSDELVKELEYWRKNFAAVSKPRKLQDCSNTLASAENVCVELDAKQSRALLKEAQQAYHTRINDILLTALSQAFTQQSGENSLLFDLEGHGRDLEAGHLDLSRTLGWFTAIFPVLLTVESRHPGEALKSVKEQLRRIPNRGIGYGILRYVNDDEAISGTLQGIPRPDILFNYLGQLDQSVPATALFSPVAVLADSRLGALRSPRGIRSHLLEINSFVAEGQFHAVWTYSHHIHTRREIEELARIFIQKLQALIEHCLSPEAGGYTPSDFSAARLNQQQLDKIMNTLKRR